MEHLEAKSYLVPYDPASRTVFWFCDTFPPNTWSKPHAHFWGELVYSGHGCMVVCTDKGNWVAPPQRAVWVPAGCQHEWYVPCETKDCSLWIDQSAFAGCERFARCHMMEITPLVRELLLYITVLPRTVGADRAAALLLELLVNLEEVHGPLTMPRDRRLVEMCTSLLNTPGLAMALSQWARRLGMSERNLARLFYREAGMPFRTWRQNRRMQSALVLLQQGENVTSVALETGYSSVSAFIAAFKQVFGCTPGRILREGRACTVNGLRQDGVDSPPQP